MLRCGNIPLGCVTSCDILGSVHPHPGSRDQLDVTNYQEDTARYRHSVAHRSIVSFIMYCITLDETFSPFKAGLQHQTGPARLSAPKRITPARDDNKVYGVSICEQLCVVITRRWMQPSVQLSPASKKKTLVFCWWLEFIRIRAAANQRPGIPLTDQWEASSNHCTMIQCEWSCARPELPRAADRDVHAIISGIISILTVHWHLDEYFRLMISLISCSCLLDNDDDLVTLLPICNVGYLSPQLDSVRPEQRGLISLTCGYKAS